VRQIWLWQVSRTGATTNNEVMEAQMKRSLFLAVVTAAALLPVGAQASGLSYNYWDLAYVNTDPDGLSKKLDGYGVGGSFEVIDRIFIYGNYSQVDTGIDGYNVNVTDYALGAGYAWPLRENFDLIGRAGYVGGKLDVEHVDSVEDDGYALGVGARARFIDQLEVEGGVQFADYSHAGSTTAVGLGAQWYFTPSVAVTVSGSFSDDATTYAIGLRGTWGR
jgi:hypothetical protein